MKLQKKQIQILLLVLLSIFAYTSWMLKSDSVSTELTNEDFIRFHVIANSDSESDQALKLLVRDGLLRKINEELAMEAMSACKAEEKVVSLDMDSSRAYLLSNLDEITRQAENIIRDSGYAYTASAILAPCFVPEKTYGTVTFPAGCYEALNITIGRGEGKNWWCVLFPPLCLIGAPAPEEMEADVVSSLPITASALALDPGTSAIYKKTLGEKKYEPLAKATKKPTTLKLKFKTLEHIKFERDGIK